MMGRESALRTNPHSLERLLTSLSRALGNPIGRFIHPLLHLLDVLQLRKFARDDSNNDILVSRQMDERLETARPLGIVL